MHSHTMQLTRCLHVQDPLIYSSHTDQHATHNATITSMNVSDGLQVDMFRCHRSTCHMACRHCQLQCQGQHPSLRRVQTLSDGRSEPGRLCFMSSLGQHHCCKRHRRSCEDLRALWRRHCAHLHALHGSMYVHVMSYAYHWCAHAAMLACVWSSLFGMTGPDHAHCLTASGGSSCCGPAARHHPCVWPAVRAGRLHRVAAQRLEHVSNAQ
jgi:hypothetical protein